MFSALATLGHMVVAAEKAVVALSRHTRFVGQGLVIVLRARLFCHYAMRVSHNRFVARIMILSTRLPMMCFLLSGSAQIILQLSRM